MSNSDDIFLLFLLLSFTPNVTSREFGFWRSAVSGCYCKIWHQGPSPPLSTTRVIAWQWRQKLVETNHSCCATKATPSYKSDRNRVASVTFGCCSRKCEQAFTSEPEWCCNYILSNLQCSDFVGDSAAWILLLFLLMAYYFLWVRKRCAGSYKTVLVGIKHLRHWRLSAVGACIKPPPLEFALAPHLA